MKDTDFSFAELDALMEFPIQQDEGIAIIGMAARIADMDCVDELWEALCEGKCAIRPFPQERRDQLADYVRVLGKTPQYENRAYFDNIDRFDAALFRVTPRDAARMDPAQRIFAQIAWQALEDGGYGPRSLSGSKTGIFVGFSSDAQSYARYLQTISPAEEANALAGTVNSVIASRISYLLNLKGPAMLVDTACSSSLVAVHMACESLRRKECSMAIAGGIKVLLAPDLSEGTEVTVASADGITRTFDERGKGTGGGEGAAAVLLKPYETALRDKDHIYAVIKGSAINQDGQTVGITAPNTQAQQDMLLEAWDKAGLPLETAGYIEAHGTATPLGDSIEIEALTKSFRLYTQASQFCAIGSVKTNVGHLDCAAGILGLVKTAKVVQTGKIPPSLHFNSPNRQLELISSPLYVNDRLSAWQGSLPRRAGVSSFGMSGTNCHVVLEQAPAQGHSSREVPCVLTLSAATEPALRRLIEEYQVYFEQSDASIQDICHTSNVSRGDHKLRTAFLLWKKEDYAVLAAKALEGKDCTGAFGGDHPQMQDYLRGKAPHWEAAAYSRNAHKVSLPTYSFEKTAYWVTPQIRNRTLTEKQLSHPLLDRILVDTPDCRVYESCMSPEYTLELREHRLGGHNTLAGTVYIELIRAAMVPLLHREQMELRDLVFLAPMTCDKSQELQVQTVILRKGNFWEVRIQSTPVGATHWTPHVESAVWPLEAMPRAPELSALQRELSPYFLDSYVANSGNFIQVGPHWNLPLQVFSDGKRVLTHVWMPEEMTSVLDPYGLYPALLDGSIHGCNVLNQQGFCLPFCFSSLRLYGKTSTQSYGLMEPVEGGEGVNTYNGFLYTQTGELVAELHRYSMRQIDQSEDAIFGKKQDDAFHQILWEPSDEEFLERERESTLLLYHPRQAEYPLCARFPATPVADEEAILEVLDHYQSVERIIFLLGLSSPWSLADVKILYHLCHYLESHKNWKTELTVVTANACSLHYGQATHPYRWMLAAMVQSLPQECSRLRVSCVDVGEDISPEELFLILRRSHSHITVAYRQGVCYVPRLSPVQPQRQREITFSPEGVYLITGGLGGMGLALTKAILQSQPEARIALLTRRSLSAEEISALELPERVSVCTCDVTDAPALQRCIVHLRKKFGRLRGVFHGAGITGGGIYLRRSWEEFSRVLAPKVVGTHNLYEILREDPPDFLLLFSSYASVLYPMGQGDYVAANAFLDAFCTQAPWIQTVNWAGWSESGMAVAQEADQSKNAVDSLKNGEAIQLLWQAMASMLPRLLLGRWSKTYFDPQNYTQFYLLQTGGRILEDVTQSRQIQLYGKLCGEPTSTELQVAQAWAKVLGLEELDYTAKFLEVGGDSISAANLQKVLNSIYPNVLDITDVFIYSSIGEMANYIDANRTPPGAILQPSEPAAPPQDDTMELLTKLSSGDIDLEKALALIGG